MDLYLGNLSYLTTEEELAALLAPFGSSAPPRLALDPVTGLPRGYALVAFDDERAAQEAVEALNGATFRDRVIIVRLARPGQ